MIRYLLLTGVQNMSLASSQDPKQFSNNPKASQEVHRKNETSSVQASHHTGFLQVVLKRSNHVKKERMRYEHQLRKRHTCCFCLDMDSFRVTWIELKKVCEEVWER